MALQVGVAAGQVDLAVGTALGTVSCSINPMEVAGQVLKAAQSLQEATIAAGMCEDICKDIQQTAINRLPIVCELLRLGQLFPERQGVDALNQALLRCFKSVCDALYEARTAMYAYLQCNRLTRLRQAASVKELMSEKRWQLRNRFADMSDYMSLAILLRSQQSEEQAQHTAAAVRELQRQVRELEGVRTADRARVKAVAKAALARQEPEGQTIKVSKRDVLAVAVSPSGSKFVTVSLRDFCMVWDAATGIHMYDLCSAHSLAWSPDGSRIATGGQDYGVAVWDAATGTCMHELHEHGDGRISTNLVLAVAWSPDGSRVATGTLDDTANLWDVATGTCMHQLRGHSHHVIFVAWSPDGSRVATGSFDSTAAVWDAATGACMHRLQRHSARVISVAWSPDGSRVATGSFDNTAVVWNAATGTCMHDLQGHSDRVISIAWSPDGSRVATRSVDHTAAVWDAATGACMHRLHRHSQPVDSVEPRLVNDDGERDETGGVWDSRSGMLSSEMLKGGLNHTFAYSVAWSPDGTRLATGSGDMYSTGAVWDAATGTCMHELGGHTGVVRSVAWTPDGDSALTASVDGTVRIYSLAGRRN